MGKLGIDKSCQTELSNTIMNKDSADGSVGGHPNYPATLSVVRREQDIVPPRWARGRVHSVRFLRDARKGRWRWTPETDAPLSQSGGLGLLVAMGELKEARMPARYSVAFVGDCAACNNTRMDNGKPCADCHENGVISEVILVDSQVPRDSEALRAGGYEPTRWRPYRLAAKRFAAIVSNRRRKVPTSQKRVIGDGPVKIGMRISMLASQEAARRGGRMSNNLKEIQQLADKLVSKAPSRQHPKEQ